MPNVVRTARGELVDFDALKIKQQLAQAPMNVEVARRKEFIDSKEGKRAAVLADQATPTAVEEIVEPEAAVKKPSKVK